MRHYTHVSAWKAATLDSVPWRMVQSLNSRFEIICACALLYTAKTYTHTRARARIYIYIYIYIYINTHTYTHKHTHNLKWAAALAVHTCMWKVPFVIRYSVDDIPTHRFGYEVREHLENSQNERGLINHIQSSNVATCSPRRADNSITCRTGNSSQPRLTPNRLSINTGNAAFDDCWTDRSGQPSETRPSFGRFKASGCPI